MDEHSNVYNVAIGGGNNKKCIGSRLYQMIDKWVVNVLKEETMSFSAQTNVMGFILLLPLIFFFHLANQSPVTGLIAKEVAKNQNQNTKTHNTVLSSFRGLPRSQGIIHEQSKASFKNKSYLVKCTDKWVLKPPNSTSI